MKEITVSITETEFKALSYIAVDPIEWVENLVKERCRTAIDEIFEKEINRLVEDSSVTDIPADKETIVANAKIETAAEKQNKHIEKLNGKLNNS